VVIEFLEEGQAPTKLTRQHTSYGPSEESTAGPAIRVALREPVSVKAGVRYTIAMTATGSATYRGSGGLSDVTVDVVASKAKGSGQGLKQGVKFTFSKSKKDFSGTDVSVGQFPQIFFVMSL